MQTRLFAGEYPARPKRGDAAVIDLAAKELLPDVMQWLDGEGEEERTYQDLRKVLDRAFEYDGYDLAQEMDRLGYESDADLVEILDGGGINDAHRTVVEEWVRAHDLRLTLAIGAQVTARLYQKTVTGEVTGLHPRTAEYTVMVPSEGHVKAGLGTHGYIVGFENVTAMEGVTDALPR